MLKYIARLCFSVAFKMLAPLACSPKTLRLPAFFLWEYKKWLPQVCLFGIIGYFCIMLHI